MKKIKLGIAGALAIIMTCFLGYKFIYRICPRNFLGDNITLAYVNENLSSKNFKGLKSILEDNQFYIAEKDLENIKKYVNNIYIFSENPIFETEKDYIGVVDTGMWYPFLVKNMDRYFNKLQYFYVLKGEYQNKYFNGKQLYVLPYRGQFLVSTRSDILRVVDRKNYVKNRELGSHLDREAKNNLGILIYNGKKENSLAIKTAYLTGKVEKDKVKLYLWQESSENIAGYSEEGKQNRILKEYLKPNILYFTLSDFDNIEDAFYRSMSFQKENKDMSWIWQGYLGFKVTDLMRDELGGEFLFDLKKGDALISLHRPKKIKQAFKFFSRNNAIEINDKKLFLEDKKLTYGETKFELGTLNPTLTPHTFLYLKMNLNEFDGKGNIEMQGEAEKRSCFIHGEMDRDAVNSLIKYIEKEVHDDKNI